MKRLGALVGVSLAAVVASCALLLDFEELQGGGQDASLGGTSSGGAGGSAGSAGDAAAGSGGTGAGGSGGAGGSDGGPPECQQASDCDDDDPLTSDACDASRCVYAPVGTAVVDGFVLDQPTPRALRVTLASFGDQVVVSTFAAGVGVRETKLHTFAAQAPNPVFDATTDVLSLLVSLPDGGVSDESPGSAVGMLEVAGQLHAFFTTFKSVVHTKVWHVLLDSSLGLVGSPTLVTTPANALTYDVGLTAQSRQVPLPVIVNNDQVAAAYVRYNGNVELRGPTGGYGTFDVGADYVAPVSVPGGSGLAYLKSNSSTYAWRVGGTTQEHTACYQQGTSWSPLSVTSPVPGLTFSVYSSNTFGSYRTDARAFFCDTTGCLVVPTAASDCPSISTEFVRNPAIHGVLTSAKPKQGVRVRLASVFPAVTGNTTNLYLNTGFADVADDASSGAYPTVIVKTDTGPAGSTADYPAVLVVGDRVFVAWISGSGGSELVHLRRYRLLP
ncbi:MAG: hypothetical protein KF718_20430 [Polyangiaceae bacterium]|nr:hypothetical protein [Polyangiaceae bacterium]